jgi:membrane protein YdbS with pleckstrin-like domain
MTRHLRHALVASAAALVAGVTALLALAAAQEAWTSRGAAVLLALAAVWLSQGIRPLLTHRRHHQ